MRWRTVPPWLGCEIRANLQPNKPAEKTKNALIPVVAVRGELLDPSDFEGRKIPTVRRTPLPSTAFDRVGRDRAADRASSFASLSRSAATMASPLPNRTAPD